MKLKKLCFKLPFMTEKIYSLMMYIFMGGITTVINIASFWFFASYLNIDYRISNFFAWFLSVVFAYISNRIYVFESQNKGLKLIFKEVVSFVSFRILSFLIDLGVLILLVDMLSVNELWAKVFTNVIVLVLNYVFSKFFIFSQHEEKSVN
ncbi:GtrA family protein [Isobaculum melis]|uniref:Putative flippase GtrA (Transmembrane translocase of bactoprenol-linked glucose) n=1 Tax=Isobaculum melis TaxID=142588 RepID=A0A1H9QQZ6_9LACT|nr:GtrA family protein [Isobaculum melis]SER62259.1 Putative flippase GtrA (transmembrane translocase of bactoprenol-linked glucose) [Isobaculum melis]